MALINVPIPSIKQAAQNTARALQQALAQAVQKAKPATLTPVDIELARSNIKALAFVQGVGLHGAYRYMRDYIARQAIPSRSSKEFLDGWLETYDMKRKEPAPAKGEVYGSGVDGELLPAGTLLQHAASGRQFRVLADAAVSAGMVSPQVMAVQVGASGNLQAGAELTLVSPVFGINSAFVATDGLEEGADIEKDSEAVYRLVQLLSNERMGGSPADYARWALVLTGITRAWGLRNPVGPTSAGVIIMADNNLPHGLPTTAQQEAVYDYITDPKRGPPDELFVIIPAAQVIPFTIRLFPDTQANRTAALAAMKDLFFREAVPGGKLPHNHVVESISAVDGEYNHQILSPAMVIGGEFVSDSYAHLLVLGDITWAAP